MLRVYFTFDYRRDLHRVKQIYQAPNIVPRAAGGFVDRNVWKEALESGDKSVTGLINDAIINADATVVCIGFRTTSNKYLDYEIQRTIDKGIGLVAVLINHLKNRDGTDDAVGHIPMQIEATGYRTYKFTDKRKLTEHIEEAIELSKLSLDDRLMRLSDAGGYGAPQEQRNETRENLSVVTVQIDDKVFPVKNWNTRGFMAMFYAGNLKEDDETEIILSATLADSKFRCRCRAKILWVDPTKLEIGGLFVDLDAETKAALKHQFSLHMGT